MFHIIDSNRHICFILSKLYNMQDKSPKKSQH